VDDIAVRLRCHPGSPVETDGTVCCEVGESHASCARDTRKKPPIGG
jgi:hypothetical protein